MKCRHFYHNVAHKPESIEVKKGWHCTYDATGTCCCSHCCHEQAATVEYQESVSVFLVAGMRITPSVDHIVLSSVYCLAVAYFSALSRNLSKPTGHVMKHQFNIQQLYALPTLYLWFCVYLTTKSDLCHLQHKMIDFYNPDEKCLQRGTDWGFK